MTTSMLRRVCAEKRGIDRLPTDPRPDPHDPDQRLIDVQTSVEKTGVRGHRLAAELLPIRRLLKIAQESLSAGGESTRAASRRWAHSKAHLTRGSSRDLSASGEVLFAVGDFLK